jgi:hypothetical protein
VKVLNLDEFAAVTREVTIGGKQYAVRDMTVEGFIEYTNLRDNVEKQAKEAGGARPTDAVELMRMTVSYALPDAPKDVIGKLTISQLLKLIEFVNGELDKDAATTQPESAVTAGEGDAAKKS